MATVKRKPGAARSRSWRYDEFVDLFYRVHYRLGMTMEAAMCDGVVSRTQGAVLWLVASEIDAEGNIMRKEVERRLREWYETSDSNVSKLLRDLAKPPLEFITQRESPHSGREKVISLTPAGIEFIRAMKKRGHRYFDHALKHMSEEVMSGGSAFFKELFSVPLAPAESGLRITARQRGKATLKSSQEE